MLRSDAGPYEGTVWRVVENQAKASTMRLTGTLEEQALLEDLVETVKPALPPECQGLDYLLATPFRYAPYPEGSRFRRARQREGAYYAAEQLKTALAEAAYYLLRFVDAMIDAPPPDAPIARTAFSIRCRSAIAIDLTRPPLVGAGNWTNPVDYTPCQDLADRARREGIEIIRYASVRSSEAGANVALLSPKAFAASKPDRRSMQHWQLLADRRGVRAWPEFGRTEGWEFPRAQFAGDPRIALP